VIDKHALLQHARRLVASGEAPGIYTGLALALDAVEAAIRQAADAAYELAASELRDELSLILDEQNRRANGK
jgi:hypothetical protein